MVPETADPPPAQPAVQTQAAFDDPTITNVELDANLTSKPGISGTRALPVSELTRPQALDAFFSENPHALLDVPCDQVPKWQSIAQHEVPQSVLDRLKSDPAFALDDWYPPHSWVQELEDATGGTVNMDFFGVRVPTSALPGAQSPAQYLENVRKDFPTYVDTTLSRFEFYPGLEGEQQRWESDDPLGTAFSIQLMAGGVDWIDDGTVATTGYNSEDWTFSTVYSPADGFHPVSGNRRFGYQDNGDGTVTLYTRGVDRLSNYGTQLGNWLSKFKPSYRPDGIAFINADDLWASFQQAIAADIGTQATILTPVTHRTDYDKVAAVLNREADPSTLLICK